MHWILLVVEHQFQMSKKGKIEKVSLASGSSWTLGHTGGSRLWAHRCPKGKAVGGLEQVPRQTTARQRTSLETNVLSPNRRQDKRSALHTMIGSLRSRMAIFLICFESFSPCRDQDPAWTPTSMWRYSRGRHQLRANALECGAPWLSNAGAGSEASRPRVCRSRVSCICSMVFPERVIVVVTHNSRAAQQHTPAT